MPRPAKHALTVLASPELRAQKADLKQLQTAAIDLLTAISKSENAAAKGAPIVGITLMRVKASMPHGTFVPWMEKLTGEDQPKGAPVKKRTDGAFLPRLKVRQLQYYMRLGLVFIEKTKLAKPDLIALGNGTTALDLGDKHEAKKFMVALDSFVGDLSLNELLIKHDIKSVGLKTELKEAGADEDDEGDELTPAQKLKQQRENAWNEAWNSALAVRASLTEPEKIQLITDVKHIEMLKAELIETTKLAEERLTALRAKK